MGVAAEGRFEAVVDGRAVGWAWDRDDPETPLEVEVLVDRKVVAAGLADIERESLADAGIGDGRHGFDIPLPDELGDGDEHTILVRVGPDSVPALFGAGFETISRAVEARLASVSFIPEDMAVYKRYAEPFEPEEESLPDPGGAALVGKRGWLFQHDDDHLTVQPGSGPTIISEEVIAHHRDRQAQRHEKLRDLRISSVFAFAPLKERIYLKFLPEGLTHPVGLVAKLNSALRSTNGGDVCDLGPALVEARRGGPAFPRGDSRWSDRGAFFAYRELMREAGKRVVGLEPPLLEDDVRFSSREDFSGDLASKPKVEFADGAFRPVDDDREWAEALEVADHSDSRSLRMPAPEHLEVTGPRAPHLYEIPGAVELPRAVLLGDSSCLSLIPWLGEHFSRLVFLWTDELPLEAIELEMPDVLIRVVSERALVRAPSAGE